MPWMIVKQPNGRYARWSSVVDDFTHLNLTRQSAKVVCRRELGERESAQKMNRADSDDMNGKAGSGLDRWNECLDTLKSMKKTKSLEEALALWPAEENSEPEPEPAFKGSLCPQCGFNVKVDEDGLCASCGATAVGDGADEALLAREHVELLRKAGAELLYSLGELVRQSMHYNPEWKSGIAAMESALKTTRRP